MMPSETSITLVGWAFLAAFCLAAIFVRVLFSQPLHALILDKPNDRSLHTIPVPRTGGIGLDAAAFLTWAALAPAATYPAMLLALILAGVSLADDIAPLSAGRRLLVHVAVATLAVIVYHPAGLAVAPLAILTFVWMANLYNFMDGSDGLAGGMALIGFGTYAAAAFDVDAAALAIAAASLAGAAGGFLIWNFPKAKIFMGDSGSVPLGFLAALLGYLGWQDGIWPFYFPALVFLPFIADVTVTLIRRALRGERLSDAHRTHYYQRLNQMGLGHRKTALYAYALMLAVAASALLALHLPGIVAGFVIGLWLVGGALLMRNIDRAWRAFENRSRAVPVAPAP